MSQTTTQRTPRGRLPLPPISTFKLSEFAAAIGAGTRRFRYLDGEHVTVLAPTGWGKSHLIYHILGTTATPELPSINMVIKPRDPTAQMFASSLDMPRVSDWPLMTRTFRRKHAGYTVWPRLSGDPERDELLLYMVMRRVLRHSYAQGLRKNGKRIVFADEVAGLGELPPPNPRTDKNLDYYLKTIWRQGRSMGIGLWAASQRPVDIPRHAYSMAQHLFIGNDPDKQARDRYAEIGGIDPEIVKAVTATLPKWHWLYIRRDGQKFAIISPG